MVIHELAFENMGNWPWFIKLGFTAIVIILLALVLYIYEIKPLHKKIEGTRLEHKKLCLAFEKKEKEAATLSTYQRQADQISKNNGLLLQQLPRAWNVPQLVQTLSKMGINRGLEFKAIKPQTDITVTDYIILPLQISVQGSYYQLGRFVADVAQLKPIITLDSFTLLPSTDNQRLQMDFTAHIYRHNTVTNAMPVPNIPITPVKPLPILPKAISAQYQYPQNLNPFSAPVASNNIPTINQSDSALQRYPFKTLMMAGTLTRDNQTWALIVTPDGQIVRVGMGDDLGLEKNRIIAISPAEITLEANSTDNTRTTAPTLLYLSLKSVE